MEQVFVVNRADFFAGDWPQGFVPLAVDAARELLAEFERRGFFVDRPRAEGNPAWKQLIPYCVVTRGAEVFTVERATTQGEQRLHGRLSIGLGGHVNPPDATGGPGILLPALRRELDEELAIQWQAAQRDPVLLGLLNDDSDAVGAVHAGLVFRLAFPANHAHKKSCDDVCVRETTAMVGGFRHLVEAGALWQDRVRFESWSRILLEVGIAGPKAVSSRSGNSTTGLVSGREEPCDG